MDQILKHQELFKKLYEAAKKNNFILLNSDWYYVSYSNNDIEEEHKSELSDQIKWNEGMGVNVIEQYPKYSTDDIMEWLANKLAKRGNGLTLRRDFAFKPETTLEDLGSKKYDSLLLEDSGWCAITDINSNVTTIGPTDTRAYAKTVCNSLLKLATILIKYKLIS